MSNDSFDPSDPIAPMSQARTETAKSAGPPKSGGDQPKVLLVDDQPARLLTYESILEGTGVSCVRALSGLEALERLLKDTFAVILLDVSMPGMDGFETARHIREHPRFERTPIVFVTGVHITELDKLRGYEVGAIDYIPVPLVPEILRSKVTLLVELYTRQAELQRLNRELADAHARLRAGTDSTATEPSVARNTHGPNAISFVLEAIRSESGDIAFWRFLDANRSALEFFNHSRADLIGMRLDDIAAAGEASLAALCTQVMEGHESHSFETLVNRRKVIICLSPVGENTVIASVGEELGYSCRLPPHPTPRTEPQLPLHSMRSAALLRLSDAFRLLNEPAELAHAASAILGETLRVRRCGYGTIDMEAETITIERDWNAPGSDTIAGLLYFRDYGTYIDELKRGETVVCVDVKRDPRTAATARALEAIQVRSFINMPVVEKDRPVALLYLTDATPREWSDEDLTFIREVAERTRIAVERRRSERALADDLAMMAVLQGLSSRLISEVDAKTLFEEVLTAAISITGADAATLQLLDQSTQTLTFGATQGLEPRLVSQFERVDVTSGSSCGRALASRQRTTVHFDVDPDHDPDGSLRAHFAYGLRSAQSTPLISRSGRILGMFSTHWRTRRGLTSRETRFLDLLSRQAADLIDRLESDRNLREADRRKDEFIAMLSHELRNPLVPIRTGISLLKGAADPDGLLRKIQPPMERQVAHLVRLIDDLLDVARITSGHIELRLGPVTLADLMETAIEAHRQAIADKGLTLSVEVREPDQLVNVDGHRMVQVISNLLSNATQFTSTGGRIHISATTSRSENSSSPIELWVKVCDTGAGIAPHRIARIFDLFGAVSEDPKELVSRSGLGVGLALARRIVQLHGGTLDANSDGVGRGAEFIIRAPMGVENGALEPPTPHEKSLVHQARILVVDDNRDAAELMMMLIQSMGWSARVAYGGLSAIDMTNEVCPELILLDIGLPDIDGYEVCRRLRRRHGQNIRIVALTGWGQQRDKQAAARAGFDEYLTKPVDRNSLQALIHRLVKQ